MNQNDDTIAVQVGHYFHTFAPDAANCGQSCGIVQNATRGLSELLPHHRTIQLARPNSVESHMCVAIQRPTLGILASEYFVAFVAGGRAEK